MLHLKIDLIVDGRRVVLPSVREFRGAVAFGGGSFSMLMALPSYVQGDKLASEILSKTKEDFVSFQKSFASLLAGI